MFINWKNMCPFSSTLMAAWIKRSDKVYNFVGFIQGDRLVFIVKEFMTKKIKLVEFDFEDSRANLVKKKKLK
ncbi:MAG TPA: hypothetical protein HA262_05390 [Methanosarcina sp.]|nr:hypothetical protein [Methanosarcina sp.]